ncbi:threonine/homoserine efflux transporter RhtA [Yoonia maricola]|uniref:Threonine/homoserine efflux transporter RhtA n=1 Tax=Yoonia maricola TaxID=420999 RepID=A0A2M8WMT0_9RHOB|nr:DMT family transporter [Yoonia maricola]PJI92223.1 threonine/homoserine efflux transporter RhtA [Yoonia maricola]
MASHSEIHRPDNVPLGVATIVGTVLALSLGDALIKSLGGGGGMGLWQLFFVRSLLAFPVLLGAALVFFSRTRLAPRSVGWIAIRSLLLTAMWIAYYLALPLLPLAVAAAAYYTLPLFIVAFAALFGGETVGRSQWVGVAVGFIGILLVLRPGSDAFVWSALLPILSAVLYALAMILTRTKCRNENPATLALGLNAAFVLVGFTGLLVGWLFPVGAVGFLSPDWTTMGSDAWLTTGILAILILMASVGTAVAYQAAPASTVGTFDFAYVGFALIWGALFFAERPDNMALAGIALIVIAGVLAVQRS